MTKKKSDEKDSKKSLQKESKKKKSEKKEELVSTTEAGGCLSLVQAGTIVQECANGPHDIDKTLEEIGLISSNLRLVFRECIFNGVLAAGCNINRSDIPHDADTTLREVMEAIQAAAS